MLHKDLIGSLSIHAHNVCNSIVTNNLHYDFIYQALICGQKITNSEIKMTLISAGLVHIMVVSGAHLIFVEQFLNKLKLKPNLHLTVLFPLLILYASTAGFLPPVSRALTSLIISKINLAKKLFWPKEFCVLLSVIICITINPAWITSYSLHLSWISACVLSCPTFNSSTLKRNSYLYIFLLPPLIQFGAPGPYSILINVIFLPFFGSVLFPLTWISGFISPLRFFTDNLWAETLSLLSHLAESNPPLAPESIFSHKLESFAYACCVQFICITLFYRRKSIEY